MIFNCKGWFQLNKGREVRCNVYQLKLQGNFFSSSQFSNYLAFYFREVPALLDILSRISISVWFDIIINYNNTRTIGPSIDTWCIEIPNYGIIPRLHTQFHSNAQYWLSVLIILRLKTEFRCVFFRYHYPFSIKITFLEIFVNLATLLWLKI